MPSCSSPSATSFAKLKNVKLKSLVGQKFVGSSRTSHGKALDKILANTTSREQRDGIRQHRTVKRAVELTRAFHRAQARQQEINNRRSPP